MQPSFVAFMGKTTVEFKRRWFEMSPEFDYDVACIDWAGLLDE